MTVYVEHIIDLLGLMSSNDICLKVKYKYQHISNLNITYIHVNLNINIIFITGDPLDDALLKHVASELGEEWKRLATYLNIRRVRLQVLSE